MGSEKICQCFGSLPPSVTLPVIPLRSPRMTLVKFTRPVFSTRMSSVAGCVIAGNVKMRRVKPAIERACEFLVDIHLRVIVQAIHHQVAAFAGIEPGAIQHIPIRLVHVLHGEQSCRTQWAWADCATTDADSVLGETGNVCDRSGGGQRRRGVSGDTRNHVAEQR